MHDFNKYATDMFLAEVPPNVFESNVFSEEDKVQARSALKLIIAAYDEAIRLYDNNEHIFYNRGRAYAQVYLDTKQQEFKDKALEDLNRALEMGLDMATQQIDILTNK